jgi:hypothetical protein
MADSSKVELILTADSRQAVQGIRETQKAADDLNKTVVAGTKQQVGAIESVEAALKELEQGKKKAYDPDQIARYNKKIQEAKYELDQLNKAGLESGKSVESLTGKISKWALALGGAAAGLKILLNAFKETTAGINLFNQIGAVTKQVLQDIVQGRILDIAHIRETILIQKELNALRIKEYKDNVQAAKQQLLYNKYYFEASNQRKTDTERIELYSKAITAHNKMIDIKIENTKEELEQAEKQYLLAPNNEKRLKRVSELQTELINIEAERYSGIKRIESAMTSLIDKNFDEVNKAFTDMGSAIEKWEEDYSDTIEKAAEKQRRSYEKTKKEKYDLYKEYFDWYRDQVDKTIKDESDAKEKAWDEEMEMANWLFKINKHLAEEQAGAAGLLDTESEEGKKNFDSLKQAAGKIVDVYMDMTDRMVEDAERRRQLFDEQIAETQRSLDLELQLMEDGYANNVDAKRKEIEELKKLRAEALKNEEEAIRKQRIADSIIQGVNLATSVTQILKEYTKIPLIGIGLAGAAIAALFTLFSSAKSRAAASTKLAEGGTGSDTGIITGKSHAAGGEHFLSHVEVERGERWGVLNRKASDRFGRTFDYMVSSFNKGEMPLFSEPEYSNNVTVNNDGSNSRLDKVISEQRKLNKKFNTDQIIMAGQKKIIRNGNKLRIVG